jgi:hypothetical protein
MVLASKFKYDPEKFTEAALAGWEKFHEPSEGLRRANNIAKTTPTEMFLAVLMANPNKVPPEE